MYITFSADFRRNVMTYVIGGYKTYMTISIKSSLQKERVDVANEKLLKFIKVSEFLDEGKSNFLSSIYEATQIVESKVSSEEDYLKLNKVFEKLIESTNMVSQDLNY